MHNRAIVLLKKLLLCDALVAVVTALGLYFPYTLEDRPDNWFPRPNAPRLNYTLHYTALSLYSTRSNYFLKGALARGFSCFCE